MASWTLGKIFSVDEGKEATQDPSVSDGDSSDDDDDDDVMERQAAFNKNKQKNNSVSPVTGSNRSVRRYDEFGDFLSRSERAHHEKSKVDQAPSTAKRTERQGSGVKGKVSFCEGDKLQEVHEIPRITPEEKNVCFMGTENWVSIDNDIELTTKRWTNHVEGTIAFDEDNNTIRGIEVRICTV